MARVKRVVRQWRFVGGPLAHVVLWSTCYLLKVDRDGEDETASLWFDFSAGVGFVAWLKQHLGE